MRRIAVWAGIVFVLSALFCGVGVWSLRETREEIRDPKRYSKLLRVFSNAVTRHLPQALPADASDASLMFLSRGGGIGPGSFRMEVHFVTSTHNAMHMAETARRFSDVQEESAKGSNSHRFTVIFGDRIGLLETDEQTGHVNIEVRIN